MIITNSRYALVGYFITSYPTGSRNNCYIFSLQFCFCSLRADFLESKVTCDRELSIYFFGYPRASRRRLKFARHSSNVVFEEFVLSSLIASPLIKPLFTPGGWHDVKWVY